MNPSPQTYTFHVIGMHCQSCVLLTETELQEVPGVMKATSRLAERVVEVTGTFTETSPTAIAERLNQVLAKHGYTLSIDPPITKPSWQDFKIAIPLALLFAIGFVLLQRLGIVNLIDTSHVSYGTSFLIGVVASLSTCMAVVGGLVLSISASFAKEGDKTKPQLLFHLGRLLAFFLLGGAIGSLGAVFTLNTTATFLLSLLIGLVMLVLGLNLLDTFSWTKNLQISLPKTLSKRVLQHSKLSHVFTPFLIGVGTFFLPCGFTQSMQIYTLSTGSFFHGGLTMLTFALGTLPTLSLVSFSSLTIRNNSHASIFFKTAGLIVILFALFNLINSLVVIGLIPPVFNF